MSMYCVASKLACYQLAKAHPVSLWPLELSGLLTARLAELTTLGQLPLAPISGFSADLLAPIRPHSARECPLYVSL